MINIHQHRIKNISFVLLLTSLSLMPLPARTATPDIKFVAQGEKWTDTERKSFYSQDQGSHLMPLKWFQALKQADGGLFISDSLKR
ncbi:MAG: di-heme-cytochrome C peroxidase, partial [Methylobacter sp.]